MGKVKELKTPLTNSDIENLQVGDRITLTGQILTGRDAALPRLVKLIENGESPVVVEGAAIMHTAVSQAGIAPTSSNKTEIEGSIPPLSEAGVKMHIGKGALSPPTQESLEKQGSIFVVTPPAAALLTSRMTSSEVVAFPEEGIEALHRLEVKDFPGIVAVAHGKSIY
ncbi:fumarate hydratase C-terminal domain-containing protein [Methanobacterium formicicum]|uniref:fumarate hydratase C-terminal domain-containing protein n=1 Tax=Methanobacterium formicicum TaxID=2162 RepID=UPI0024913BBE|nr:fumarate hydratase C-terminal domain-containing protein [Methanobacterium formicicum]